MLTFIKQSENRTKSGKKKAFYRCDCGRENEYISTVVDTKKINMCKKCSTSNNAEKRTLDLTGHKIGKWLVLSKVEKKNIIHRGAYWLCECECGENSVVKSSDLTAGKSKQCIKCNKKRLLKQINDNSIFKNNAPADDNRLYRIWKSMKQRCYGKYNIKNYKHQGVFICEEWKNDFMSFYNWSISNGYDDKKEIDKDMKCDEFLISPKLYSPETCIWIDKKINTRYSQLNDLVVKKELRSAYL